MFKKNQCTFHYYESITSRFRFIYSRKGAIAIENIDGNVVAKKCTNCEKYKRIVRFLKDEKKGFKGYSSDCRDCRGKRRNEWKDSHQEKVREYNKKEKRKKSLQGNECVVLSNLIKKEIEKNMKNYKTLPIEIQLSLKYDNETIRITINTNDVLSWYIER